jgi:hypothetical protein
MSKGDTLKHLLVGYLIRTLYECQLKVTVYGDCRISDKAAFRVIICQSRFCPDSQQHKPKFHYPHASSQQANFEPMSRVNSCTSKVWLYYCLFDDINIQNQVRNSSRVTEAKSGHS